MASARESDAANSTAARAATQTESDSPLFTVVRAIVIGRRNERLAELLDSLGEHGIAASLMAPSMGAFSIIESDPRVSIVIADGGELGRAFEDELIRLRYREPGLTLAVLHASASLAEKLTKLGVDHVYRRPVTAEAVAGAVLGSLAHHHLDRQILDALATSLSAITSNGKMNFEPGAPLIRVGATLLGELSGLAEISGDVAGLLLVSGSELFFARVSSAWLGEKPETRELIWDATAELVNRVAGLVRDHYAGRGLTTAQSVPMIIEGRGVSVRPATTRPSLVIPFSLPRVADSIYVELRISSKEPDRAPTDTMMPTGELTFL